MKTTIIELMRIIILVTLLATLTKTQPAFGQQKQINYLYQAISLYNGFSGAEAINNNGDIVGTMEIDPYSGSYITHAFLCSHGIVTDIDTLGSRNSVALGINNNGKIVGSYLSRDGSHNEAFLYSNGSMQDLGNLGGFDSVANAINDNGDIVGNFIPSGQIDSKTHAFLYTKGKMADLNSLKKPIGGILQTAVSINNAGQITGTILLDNGSHHGYIYSDGQVNVLNSIDETAGYPYGINDAGQVVERTYTGNSGNPTVMIYGDNTTQSIITGRYQSQPMGINNLGQVIGDTDDGNPTNYYGFIYSQGAMRILDDSIVSESLLSFVYAIGINDLGQIVGFGIDPITGQQVAGLLNPLPTGSQQAIATTPPPKTHGIMPIKDPSKNSLVVVTHGWNPAILPYSDIGWVDTMCDAINQYLKQTPKNNEINNWQVYPYKWVTNSYTVHSTDALNNAKEEGILLGVSIASQGWTHVHLISHSAGAGLIQAACEKIKAKSPNTIVQCTFLDPFVGFDLAGATQYGTNANWAENYFCKDLTGESTQQILTHAYNVDVTQLGPKIGIDTFRSSVTGKMEICRTTMKYHSEPIDFYMNTITNRNLTSDYGGFGWTLSEEAGEWDYALQHYAVGNKNALVLGVPDPTCIDDLTLPTPIYWNSVSNFLNSPSIPSPTGTVQKSINSLHLSTGSPVWLSTTLVSTSAVNTLSFDAQFTSASNASGLFTIYWDTNMIGSVDEKVVGQGWQHYNLAFPQAASNSIHMLGFRLDPFATVKSSVSVSNVMTGQVGMSQPFLLSATTNTADSNTVYELTGQAGFNYTIQASSDLVDWTPIAVLVNESGTVRFFDQTATNYGRRFYRAVAGVAGY